MRLHLLSLLSVATAAVDLTDFSYYQNRGSYEIGRYTISTGLEHYSWMWYPTNAQESVHCFVFCMGTGAVPEDYAATGEHLASHGFAAIYTPMRPWDVTRGFNYCRDATIVHDAPELEGLLNTTRLGAGGHSGGGPYAVRASSGEKDVAVVITQHSASIPVMNRQSDETMAALAGDVMVLCGTDDHMPFCGCDVGERDYYDRAPHGRALVKVPDNHVSGACFESGEKFESGYITAMLYYGLRGEKDALVAITSGKEGDEIVVDM